jgi:hypothetical protein
MSNSVNVVVTSAGVAVVAPQDCAALIAQQAQGSDPPSTAFSVYSDAALANKIADVPAGQGYQFVPSGLPGASAIPSGATVGYLKVATGTFTFTIGVVPAVMGAGSALNSLLFEGPSQESVQQIITVLTALAITPKAGTVILNTSALNNLLTLANPIPGVDDLKKLRLLDITGKAHVITNATSGFNGKGSSGTLTFGTAKGDGCTLTAYNGLWYMTDAIGVTAA